MWKVQCTPEDEVYMRESPKRSYQCLETPLTSALHYSIAPVYNSLPSVLIITFTANRERQFAHRRCVRGFLFE
jgi:hypothetical protein